MRRATPSFVILTRVSLPGRPPAAASFSGLALAFAADFFPRSRLAPFVVGEGDFSAEARGGCVAAVLDDESGELLPHPATSAATASTAAMPVTSLREINCIAWTVTLSGAHARP